MRRSGISMLRRARFRLMSSKDGTANAIVHSRGQGKDAQRLVSLRCGPVAVGSTFVSSQDAGISGTVFHTWQGGSWMQLNPGGAELDIEGHNFVLADEDAGIQVPADVSGRVLAFDGSVLNGPSETATERLDLRPRELTSNERARITDPLLTGISAVDILTPIGKGQSMLLYGPKGSGKSIAILQAIGAQRAAGVECVLVLLGCTDEHLTQVLASLRSWNAMSYTTVVTDMQADNEAAAPEVAPMLATLVATSIAEQARDRGKDVLLVQDEFEVHHSAYNSLFHVLEPDIPGRAAQSTHRQLYSGLFQRSAALESSGSLTTLVAVECPPLQPDEFASISDGHLCFSPQMVQKGHFPPIDPTKSLSRIGSRARSPALHQVGNELRMELAQHYDELQFGGEGSTRMSRVVEALKQDGNDIRSVAEQLCMLTACLNPKLTEVPPSSIMDKHHGFFPLMQRLAPQLLTKIDFGDALCHDDLAILYELCSEYKEAWDQRITMRQQKL